MVLATKRSSTLVLRLIVGLALMGWPRVGSAQGTWSVISLPQKPGEIGTASALAVDTASNLYVAEVGELKHPPRIQKRDAQGNWSVIATEVGLGQAFNPARLAVDTVGNLYVADFYYDSDNNAHSRIQKRDAQGNWSLIASSGDGLGQVNSPYGLAVDAAGNLYVADTGNDRVLKYTPVP